MPKGRLALVSLVTQGYWTVVHEIGTLYEVKCTYFNGLKLGEWTRSGHWGRNGRGKAEPLGKLGPRLNAHETTSR